MNSTAKKQNAIGCPACGGQGCQDPEAAERTQSVPRRAEPPPDSRPDARMENMRRAFHATDKVYGQAQTADGTDNRFVFMTAVLLVERLAKSLGREPVSVLGKMARCFDVKRMRAEAIKQSN
jgi:hypothetical protein